MSGGAAAEVRRLRALLAFQWRAERVSALLWTAALAAYNVINIELYRIYGDKPAIAQVYDYLPPMWKRTFGQAVVAVNTVEGWLVTQYFAFVPLLVAVYASLVASGQVTRERETRSIETLFTAPVSRATVWLSKLGVLAAGVALLLGVNALATFAALRAAGYTRVDHGRVALCYASCALAGAVLAALALAVAAASSRQRRAQALTLGAVLLLFLFNAVLSSLDALPLAQAVNPFHYHDCSRIVAEGSLPRGALAYGCLGTLALLAPAAALFVRRDV